MKYLLLVLLLGLHAACAHAQVISFKDTIATYNLQRIRLNTTGTRVLATWGIANMAAGAIGYAAHPQEDEWKYFHAMNAGWGAVNTVIATAGMLRSRSELRNVPGADKAYKRYKNNKRLYLVNSGLDVAYIVTGIAMSRHGQNGKTTNPALYTGFGNSITLQGVALLLFDNFMYAAQLRNNSNWYRIINEIRLSGNSIGINHTL